MMMDLQTALFCLLFVLVSAGGLLFISMVVTKEKSYEEAIAEQRQQSSTLLGTQTKSKLKDKKQKKAGKKVKEKVQFAISSEGDTAEDSESTEVITGETNSDEASASNTQTKHHVEFKEQVIDEPIKETSKRRSKKDKVRPILLNRDMSEEKIGRVDDDVPPANHFEQLHPKDDFELMHSHMIQREESIVEKDQSPPPLKEKAAKQKQQLNAETDAAAAPANNKGNKKAAKHQTNEIISQNVAVEKEEVVEVVPVVPQQSTNSATAAGPSIANVNNGGKDKKKKKSEQNALQQLAGDKQGVNLQTLATLVRKAELSRSEVQILIDMLLNKQHEAPAVIDEWSESKTDPVQKLKRQLAEKEKLLVEEQEAVVGAQGKLKEVRAEQIAERSQLQQKARALEEALNAKQLEIQATNNRVHGLNQKLQGLQAQVNDEAMKNRQIIEDNNAIQIIRQQLEMRLQQAEEVKETMQNDIRALTEQFENQKSVIVHQQYEMTQKDDLMKQLEETGLEMERHMNMQILQDSELKVEVQQLNTACQQHLEEVRRLELSKSQSLSDLKVQQDEYEKKMAQLNQELQRVKEEKQKIENFRENDAMEEKKVQVRIKNIQNELSSHFATIERLQNELEVQKDKNNELRKKNWKVVEALNAAESRNAKQSTVNAETEIATVKENEQLTHRKMMQRLFPTIDIDDNLPQDKWILQFEGAIRNYIHELDRPKTPEPVDNTEVVKLQFQLQKNKESLDEYDNLLKELQTRTAQTEMEWTKEIERKNAEIAIKDNTIRENADKLIAVEKELNTLKQQTEQNQDVRTLPDIQGVQFAYECIEKSLPSIINELRLQLSELETQLLGEKEINQRLTNENAALALSKESSPKVDTTVQVEKLQEEINRMSEYLLEEQRRNKELQTQIENSNLSSKTTNNHNNSSNGPSITVEKLLSSTSSAASSVNEVLIKKSKKKKKNRKNNGNQ